MIFYLFTFRPQISEFQLFETFLTIFKVALKDNKTVKQYAWSVENDNKLTRHLHVIAGFEKTKSKNNPLTQFLSGKIFKEFKAMLKNKQTNEPAGFDDRKVEDTEADFLKVLGYVMKETESVRKDTNIPLERISQALEYYYQCDHIDKSQPNKDNWTIITPKNAHVIIEKYVKDNNFDWDDFMIEEKIKIAMLRDRHTFSFNKKTQAQIFNELVIANTKYSEWHIKQEQNIHEFDPNEFTHETAYISYLQKLLKEHDISYDAKEA